MRTMADRIGVESIDREGRLIVIRFRPQAKMDPMRLVKVVHEWPGAILVPPVSLKLDLEATAGTRDSGLGIRPDSGFSNRKKPRIPNPQSRNPKSKADSWWTARATTGEVTAGFTKEEITRKPRQDPRAEGGMFSRLAALLEALAGPR
jgi:hypothetical protein